MSTATPLLDWVDADRRETAARLFHERNPHIMPELIRVSLKVMRAGRRRWSMQAAIEVLRYNAAITTDHRTYKINNNHAAFYARWIMRDVPELAGFFVTRDVGRVPQEYDE